MPFLLIGLIVYCIFVCTKEWSEIKKSLPKGKAGQLNEKGRIPADNENSREKLERFRFQHRYGGSMYSLCSSLA